MTPLSSIRRALFVPVALISVVVACGDSFEPPPELVGTWNATSLVVDGFDYVDEGMTLSFTFSDNGEYSYTANNDLLGFCDFGVANCTDSGDFRTTANQFTIDPGTEDEETFNYSVTGSTLTLSGTFDGSPFTFTFQKQ